MTAIRAGSARVGRPARADRRRARARRLVRGQAEAGPVIFVRHALPGERVRAVVTQITAKLARADAMEILSASADRVQPPCPHARPGGCGGCDWQHASLPAQRALKAAVVRQQLRRIAGIDRDVSVEPMPGDETGLGWRTRVKYAVGPGGAAGLRRHRSHDVMEIGDCPIAHPLVDAAAATARAWPGAAWVEVAAAPGSGQRAVITDRDVPGEPIDADTVMSGRRVARGTGYLRQRAAGRDWRVSASGFWQVHPAGGGHARGRGAGRAAPAAGGDGARPVLRGRAVRRGPGRRGRPVRGGDRDRVRRRRGARRQAQPAGRRRGRGCTGAMRRRCCSGNGLSGASLAVLDPPRTGLARAVIDLLSAARRGRVSPDRVRVLRPGHPGPRPRRCSPRPGGGSTHCAPSTRSR